MEKQRTYLTPEEVQEFIKSGVDFGETSCNWLRYIPVPNNEGFKCTFRLYLREDIRDDTWDDPNFEIIPAPNLQEVLDIIPNTLELPTGDEAFPYAVVSFQLCETEDEECSCFTAYHHQAWDFDDDTLHEDPNPLIATANLLRWVCKNYPETLTKN